jgi:hypothetical protein
MKILSLLPKLERELNETGEIKNISYKSLKLDELYPENESDMHNKDGLIVPRRRACLLTHTKFIEAGVAAEAMQVAANDEKEFLTACRKGLAWYKALERTGHLDDAHTLVANYKRSIDENNEPPQNENDEQLVLRFKRSRNS